MKDAKLAIEDKLIDYKDRLKAMRDTRTAILEALNTVDKNISEVSTVISVLEDLWAETDQTEADPQAHSSPSHQ